MRLRVKEVAEQQGVKTATELHFKAKLSMSTARRYWYGTTNGREDGKPLRIVHLDTLQSIADGLGIDAKDLIERLALSVAGSGQHTTDRASGLN